MCDNTKYSQSEAKERVRMKRKIRLSGLSSSYINHLETWEIEELYTKVVN